MKFIMYSHSQSLADYQCQKDLQERELKDHIKTVSLYQKKKNINIKRKILVQINKGKSYTRIYIVKVHHGIVIKTCKSKI